MVLPERWLNTPVITNLITLFDPFSSLVSPILDKGTTIYTTRTLTTHTVQVLLTTQTYRITKTVIIPTETDTNTLTPTENPLTTTETDTETGTGTETGLTPTPTVNPGTVSINGRLFGEQFLPDTHIKMFSN